MLLLPTQSNQSITILAYFLSSYSSGCNLSNATSSGSSGNLLLAGGSVGGLIALRGCVSVRSVRLITLVSESRGTIGTWLERDASLISLANTVDHNTTIL